MGISPLKPQGRPLLKKETLPSQLAELASRDDVAAVRLDAAFETFLESLLVRRDFLARLTARHRRDEEAEQAVTLEVELHRHLGAALAGRLDHHRPNRAYGSVQTLEGRLPRWIVLGDLVADLLLTAARNAADIRCARADPCRAIRIHLAADERGLPFVVASEVIEVGEDLLGTARDLDAVNDCAHGRILTPHEASSQADD